MVVVPATASNKVPYTGANRAVDLGSQTLTTTGSISLAADDVKFSIGANGAADNFIWYKDSDTLEIWSTNPIWLFGNTTASTGPYIEVGGSGTSYSSLLLKNSVKFIGHLTLVQSTLGLHSQGGRQLVITDWTHGVSDHDHGVQTNPTLYIQSVTDPDDNNTEWGSLAHTGTGTGDGVFLLDSGNSVVQIGAADNVKLALGQAGTTDSFLEWNSGNLDIYSSGIVKTLGNTQLGDATTEYHGINTAPVSSQMLTASQTEAGVDTTAYFLRGTQAHSGGGSDAKAIYGYDLTQTITGTWTSVSGDIVVYGTRNIVNANTAVEDSCDAAFIGGHGEVVFGGTTSSPGNIDIFGLKGNAWGNLGVAGTTVHYGVWGSAQGTADINYGGYFSASGATANWGIFNAAGNVFLGDDNEKTMWGTTSTDLQIYSDGTQGVFDLTGALYIRPSGDTGDYFSLSTAGDVPTIGTVGSCNLKITASSGVIDVDDEILMATAEKLNFRDTAIGVYSQADTFLDIFADGGLRIGDSSAGAPTNYAQFAADGELTLVGTARVKRHVVLPIQSASGASAPTVRVTEAPFISWTFDVAATDDAHFTIIAPHDMDYTADMTVSIEWYTSVDQTGDEVNWQIQWNAKANGEAVNAGATTDTSGDQNCPTQWQRETTLVETIPGSSIVADDVLGIDLTRIAIVGGTNPQVGTVHVLALHIEYTADKLGEAT